MSSGAGAPAERRHRAIQAILVALTLLTFNGLYMFRLPPDEFVRAGREFLAGEFRGGPLDYLRLYLSQLHDEAYYYEWSTIALGRAFEPGYPFGERRDAMVPYFGLPPRVRLPYRDLPFEYPPLLAAPLLAARSLSHDYVSFTRVLALLTSLAFVGALVAGYGIWQRLSHDRPPWTGVLALSLGSVLLLGQVWVTRLDVFPACCYAWAVNRFVAGRAYASAAWLAAGALTKAYALLLAPLFALVLARQRRYRELAGATSLVVLVAGGATIALGWWSDGGYWSSFRYHAGRGLQIESLYALVPLLGHLILETPIEIYDSHSAIDVRGGSTAALLTLSTLMTVVVPPILYLGYWRRGRPADAAEETSSLVQASVLLVFGFILTFKVFSPQFLIWLTPLLFLIRPGPSPKVFFGLWLVVLSLTHALVPNLYFLLARGHPAAVIVLTLRNLGLVGLFAWLAWDWFRRPAHRILSGTVSPSAS